MTAASPAVRTSLLSSRSALLSPLAPVSRIAYIHPSKNYTLLHTNHIIFAHHPPPTMSSLSKQLAAISASAPSAKPVSFLYSPETAASVDKETVTPPSLTLSPPYHPHGSSSSPPATLAPPSASATAASRSTLTASWLRGPRILRGNCRHQKSSPRLTVPLASCLLCCLRTLPPAGGWGRSFEQLFCDHLSISSPDDCRSFFLDVKCHLILECDRCLPPCPPATHLLPQVPPPPIQDSRAQCRSHPGCLSSIP